MSAGVELYRQGDLTPVFYVLECGWLCLYRLLSDGRRHNLKFALPGEVVRFTYDDALPVDHSAATLTSASVLVVDSNAALRRLHGDNESMAEVCCYVCNEAALTSQRLTSIARTTAIERVSLLLLDLFIRSRRMLPTCGAATAVPLTQEQIGDAVGLTSIHVNRMVAELAHRKVLRLRRGTLTILDPGKLFDLAALDPNTIMAQATSIELLGPSPARVARAERSTDVGREVALPAPMADSATRSPVIPRSNRARSSRTDDPLSRPPAAAP